MRDNKKILLKRLIDGDAKAFDEIFNKYNERIYLFSLKNLQNKQEAEEVVQEVFLNLWKDRQKLRQVQNLDAWIFKITFNTIRKIFRKLVRERDYHEQSEIAKSLHDNSTVTDIEYKDLMNQAEKIIEKLPERQKNIYLLSMQIGFSNEEISQKLKISIKTVENQISLARKFIKAAMKEDNLMTVLFFWLFLQ